MMVNTRNTIKDQLNESVLRLFKILCKDNEIPAICLIRKSTDIAFLTIILFASVNFLCYSDFAFPHAAGMWGKHFNLLRLEMIELNEHEIQLVSGGEGGVPDPIDGINPGATLQDPANPGNPTFHIQ